MNIFDCSDYSEEGLKQRKNKKMANGAEYKINEVQRRILSIGDTLESIGTFSINKNTGVVTFDYCVKDRRLFWSYDLPLSISFDLGQDVEGVLDYLEHDGVPKEEIKKLKKYASQKMPIILNLGDIARADVSSNWQAAYVSFSFRQGSMFDFLTEVDNFLSYLLGEVELWTR